MSYIDLDTDRHPSVRDIIQWFEFGHLKEPARGISESCADLAQEMTDAIHIDSAELVVGLRKLLEAKDCFVRAMMLQAREDGIDVE